MPTSLIGQIIGTPEVEDAVTATIVAWIDAYLTDIEAQRGLEQGITSRPASYNETYDAENWPEGQLPGVAVVCSGTTGEPERASGNVNAWFEVTVDLIVSGQSEADARRVAGRYQEAIATLMEQQGSLRALTGQPFATATQFQAFTINLPDVENRTLAVGTSTFHVFVEKIFDRFAGPVGPPVVSPVGNLPIAETVDATVIGAETLPPLS